ncbi:hypothetical protein ACWD9K_35815, partial [Streptomyces sp. 900116325]
MLDGLGKTLVELSLPVEHRRRHNAPTAAPDRGWLEPSRLRRPWSRRRFGRPPTGRLRSDRVVLRDPRPAGSRSKGGWPRRHGGVLTFAKPNSRHAPNGTTTTDTTHHGTAAAMAWDRMHPRLTHRIPWLELTTEELPILHGTLVRQLQIERRPGNRDPKPAWLWCPDTGATCADVDRWWQSFLRRFDLEYTSFRSNAVALRVWRSGSFDADGLGAGVGGLGPCVVL